MKQQIFYNKTINKKELKSIVHSTFQSYGIIKATNLAESLKKNGFSLHGRTKSLHLSTYFSRK